MRQSPAQRQAEEQPSRHSPSSDLASIHNDNQQSTHELARPLDPLILPKALRSDELDADETRVEGAANSSALPVPAEEPATHHGGHFDSSILFTVSPSIGNNDFVSYPESLSLHDTVAGADEFGHGSVSGDGESNRRAASRERRTKSEVSQGALDALRFRQNLEVHPGHRARSASDTRYGSHTFPNPHRPYTGGLGPPEHCHISSSRSSIVSDAGEQQAHSLRLDRESATSPRTRDLQGLDHSESPSLTNESPFQLQRTILDSFQQTKNHDGKQQMFLPQEALHSLINKKSVRRELQRELGKSCDPGGIEDLTQRVCAESKTFRGKEVTKSFRKIFVLLVLADAVKSVGRFLDEDVSDLDLPLQGVGPRGTNGLCRKHETGLGTQRALCCTKDPEWSPVQILHFLDYQWRMLAPFFAQSKKGEVKHYLLQDQHILPFPIPHDTDDEDHHQVQKTGGFGKVFMVRIHKEHHDFQDSPLCERGFAVKQQLEPEHRHIFEKEIAVLKKFSGSRGDKHIVSLLVTFEQFSKLHLVFYRAEGDLAAYWSDIQPKPKLAHGNVKWMMQQCAGLTKALFKLHEHLTFSKLPRDREIRSDLFEHMQDPTRSRARGRAGKQVQFEESNSLGDPFANGAKLSRRNSFRHVQYNDTSNDSSSLPPESDAEPGEQVKQYGRHGDINPWNILWYTDTDGDTDTLQGTLKLADFGQAELNSLKSKTRRRSVANTMTYRPPECDRYEGYVDLPVRQTYDIWCLGCVYLEFVAWMLGGYKSVARFAKARNAPDFQHPFPTDIFFQVDKGHWPDRLEVTVKESVIKFIDGLQQHPGCPESFHDLLNLIRLEMLVPDSNKRTPCERIAFSLRKILDNCEDEDYAIRPAPWKSDICPKLQPAVLKLTPAKPEDSADGQQRIQIPWAPFAQSLRAIVEVSSHTLRDWRDSTDYLLHQGHNNGIVLLIVAGLLVGYAIRTVEHVVILLYS